MTVYHTWEHFDSDNCTPISELEILIIHTVNLHDHKTCKNIKRFWCEWLTNWYHGEDQVIYCNKAMLCFSYSFDKLLIIILSIPFIESNLENKYCTASGIANEYFTLDHRKKSFHSLWAQKMILDSSGRKKNYKSWMRKWF